MAVVGSAQELERGRTATYRFTENNTEEREYTAQFIVETDNRADGPRTVLQAPGIPEYLAPWTFGNDSDTSVGLKELVPRTIGDSQKKWIVTGRWTPVRNPTKEGDTDSFNIFRIDVSFTQFQRPVEQATFISVRQQGRQNPAFVARPHPFAVVGRKIEVRNSAGEAYPEPLMRDDARMVIRYTRNERGFNANFAGNYINHVNSDIFTINRGRFSFVALPVECKMSNVSATQEFDADRGVFWRVVYEIHYRPFERDGANSGFYHRVLDKGFTSFAPAGAPDLRGGTVPAAFPAAGNQPRMVNIDQYEHAIPQPMALDGFGSMLSMAPPRFPVYHDWLAYESLPFSVFRF